MNSFGNNLRNLRRIKKLSQSEFAEKLQTTQQRVSEWECDKIEPSLYNIIKILEILEVDFEELIDGIEKI